MVRCSDFIVNIEINLPKEGDEGVMGDICLLNINHTFNPLPFDLGLGTYI